MEPAARAAEVDLQVELFRAVGEAMPKLPAACWCRKPALGAENLISTVYGSMIFVPS